MRMPFETPLHYTRSQPLFYLSSFLPFLTMFPRLSNDKGLYSPRSMSHSSQAWTIPIYLSRLFIERPLVRSLLFQLMRTTGLPLRYNPVRWLLQLLCLSLVGAHAVEVG